jgi:hypothetical protein
LEPLFAICNAVDSRSEENCMATENAISSIGKIIRVYKDSGAFPTETVISHWIQTLPITEDAEEANDVYSLFLDLIESRHPSVANASSLPQLISIATKALSTRGLFDDASESQQKMAQCVQSLMASCDLGAKQNLVQILDDSQKQYLISVGLA